MIPFVVGVAVGILLSCVVAWLASDRWRDLQEDYDEALLNIDDLRRELQEAKRAAVAARIERDACLWKVINAPTDPDPFGILDNMRKVSQ